MTKFCSYIIILITGGISMYKRICKYCGKEFDSETPSRQICDGPHYRKCDVCGKLTVIPNHRIYEKSFTCSKECSNKKKSMRIKAALANKPKGYNDHKTRYEKECVLCGKKFTTLNPQQKYCEGTHYKTCVICGKKFEVNKQQIFNKVKVCSEECSRKLREQTCLMKYGEVSYVYTDEFKQRIFEKRDQTEKKRKQTNIARYDAENKSMTANWLIDHMKDSSKFDNLKSFIEDPKRFIKTNYAEYPNIRMLATDLGINESSTLQRVHNYHLEDIVKIGYSYMEGEVLEIIRNYGSELEVIQDDRQQIKPYELDMYVPELKFAIECNPTCTHNSSKQPFGDDNPITWKYHQMKTDLCEKQGIFLFHIFGWEWTNKRKIIESMIQNLLNVYDQKIYARNCELREVSYNNAMTFLNENHRQGNSSSSIRLGLYCNDELVSLMTFSRRRSTIGSESDGEYELVRFCNKLNTQVIGGASKLFKHFLDIVNPSSVMSFSDRAHTRGNLYKVLGFQEIRRSEPGYVWVDEKTDIAYNRVNTQKHNLKKFLKDDSIDLSQTETQIMESHGFLKVYDSGTITWKWSR